jgi:hypothetical protein
MSLRVRRFGELVGASSVSNMAQKLGIQTRPLSVRNMIQTFGPPVQPTNLRISWLEGFVPQHPVDHPPNSTDVPIQLFTLEWDDPGKKTQRAATDWTVHLQFNGQAKDFNSGGGIDLDYNTIYSWQVLPRNEFGQGPSSPVFTFVTQAPPRPSPTPPSPTPGPPIPPNLVGISKLSLFNCQRDHHTVHIWVRDITGKGPWGQIQEIPTQYNASDQCPFDDNGILADSASVLTSNGEGGGFACTSGNIYQVSIVDPERPTCEGQNDPNIDNCVVEDQPLIFKFDNDGNELTLMLEDGRLAPAPL